MSMRDLMVVGERRGIVLPTWFLSVIAAGILALASVAVDTWSQVNQNTKDIANLKPRMESVEAMKSDISAIKATLQGIAQASQEQNQKLDALMQDEINSARDPRQRSN